MRFGVEGPVIVAGSMLAPSDGWRRLVRLSMKLPCSVCPGAIVPVSFASYRVFSLVLVKGIPVCANALRVVVLSARTPLKNHRRFCTTAPPAVASYVGDSLPARDAPADFSNGVSALQAEFVKFVRKAPENTLPPLRVMTLMTPPLNRPYSAEIPEVNTWTSCTASSMKRLFAVPSTLSLISTPFIRKRLS
jgi:hypothetical protein